MKIANVSYSLSGQPRTLQEWQDHLLDDIKTFISAGSDIILYPELFLMGLTDYFQGDLKNQYREISNYVENFLLPEIAKIADAHDILICLGSGPRICQDKIYNSAPILKDGEWSFQDKLHLTPWEIDFTGGTEIKIFTFRELKVAAIICFDVEQPGLALKLKEEGIHLLIVPSATVNRNGSNRVNRCANSRSVELGAAVVTTPLIGDSACELVDHNEGRQGFFLPAQAIVTCEQETYSAYSSDEKIVHYFSLDEQMLRELKRRNTETKPYLQKDHDFLQITIQDK